MSEKKLKNKKPKVNKKCENCEEYKAGWQRAQADYKNLQKEIQDKKQEWLEYSKEQILEEFIPVYENFKKAYAHHPKEGDKAWEAWSQGVGFIMKQFGDILKNQGVEEIKTVGEQFDHHLHEAVSEEDGEEEGLILKEVESGYKMGEKVIRVAKVIVSK